MTYELAEKLYKAGFPFERPYKYVVNDRDVVQFMPTYKATPYATNLTPVPTLSELIEACKFSLILEKIGENTYRAGKDTYGRYEDIELSRLEKEPDYIDTTLNEISVGKTPEEAVANLWLQLNKKS